MSYKIVTGITRELSMVNEFLEPIGGELVQTPLKTEEDIIAHAADADAILVGVLEPYTARVIKELSRCKIISRTGIGYSNIDVEEAARQGIPVSIVIGSNSQEVSDYALSWILAFNRRLLPIVQAVHGGAWVSGSPQMVKARGKMRRLNQQTLGLIGMGRIGSLAAQKAKGFGMRVIVYDPYISEEAVRNAGVEAADFDTVLCEADYISIHAQLTAETKHLFDASAFEKMKPSAYLINAARGGFVDETALYNAVSEGSIAGAALDVTDPEPPAVNNPLFGLDQVFLTGHSSWFSDASAAESLQIATDAVFKALRGEWPPTLANPAVKEQPNARIGG